MIRTPSKALRKRLPLSEWQKSLTPAQRQRLRFFEARLFWEGQVNRHDICNQFGITLNHVTREIADYRHYFPKNLDYDVSARTYRPNEHFRAKFGKVDPNEYLALLRLFATNPSPILAAELGAPTKADIIPESSGRLNQAVLRTLLQAVHNNAGVVITYQSFSQKDVTKCEVWPQSFVWTGDRWHVRVYDGCRKTYIDILPQRITKAAPLLKQLPVKTGTDIDWREFEVIEVIPHPAFTELQKEMIAQEYGMEKTPDGHVWRVALRRCIIPYFLHRHHLDVDHGKRTHNGIPTQSIVLKDLSIISRFGFPSG